MSELTWTKKQVTELAKCSSDILYFAKKCKVQHPVKGFIPFKVSKNQKKVFSAWNIKNKVIVSGERQTGKSTMTAVQALHQAMYGQNQVVGVFALNVANALSISQTIKNIYENLPEHLKIGVTIWNKYEVKFENGSKIICRGFDSCIRGQSFSMVILDEFAYAKNVEDFWSNLIPCLVRGDYKLFLLSTLSGKGKFDEIWNDITYDFERIKILR